MANYLNIIDAQGNCCNCTTRVSPCDPCAQTGACCDILGDCEITTQNACNGVWRGAGTDCNSNPNICLECDVSVAIRCDSINANRSKCGVSATFNVGNAPLCQRWFLSETETRVGGGNGNIPGCAPCTDTVDGIDSIKTWTVLTNGSCNFVNMLFSPGEICCNGNCSNGGDGCFCCNVTSQDCGVNSNNPLITITNSYCGPGIANCCTNTLNCTQCRTLTETISNEYFTNVLCENAYAALPNFSGTYTNCGGQNIAYHLLDRIDFQQCAQTCSVKETKYMLFLASPRAINSCLSWNQIFTPENGAANIQTQFTQTIPAGQTNTNIYLASVDLGNLGTINIDVPNILCVDCP